MQVTPISAIREMDDKMSVMCTRGTIKSLYKHTEKINKEGNPYTFQKGLLSDGISEIEFTTWDREDLNPLRGKDVIISSTLNQKNQYSGIKMEIDPYQGKNKPVLSIKPSATIAIANHEPAPTLAPASPARQATPPSTNTRPPATTPPAVDRDIQQPVPAPVNGIGLRKVLNRMANLYLECLYAGRYVRDTWEKTPGLDTPMTDDQFQACVSSLFIQATRDGLVDQVAGGTFQHK